MTGGRGSAWATVDAGNPGWRPTVPPAIPSQDALIGAELAVPGSASSAPFQDQDT